MLANLKEIHLYEHVCTEENNEHQPVEAAKQFKREVTDCVSTIQTLISINPKELRTQELFDLVRKAYNIVLTEEDYLKMLSVQNGKRYTRISEIKTTITSKGIANKGDGKDSSWWPVTYQVLYTVASPDEFRFSKDIDYTKEEIQKLLNKKDIVILSERLKELETEPPFRKEFYERLPEIGVTFDGTDENMSDFVQRRIYLLDTILKNKFPQRKLLEDMKAYLIALKYDIDLVFYSKYDNIVKECKAWYKPSKEREEIHTLTKSLANVRPQKD